MTSTLAMTVTGREVVLDGGTIEAFGAELRGELLTAASADDETARAVWNAMIDKRPALIARCRGAADVISAVKFARLHGLLLSVRGGGHNVAGLALCDGRRARGCDR
jgi:FAD/FMN-containing dehydrogenase